MSDLDLNTVAIEAIRLQNGYARAIDTRDWAYFQSLFASDVLAVYPQLGELAGMDAWLTIFIPFHDECLWIQHVMTTHVVGQDADGVWATCYGFVQWILADKPEVVQRSRTLYRDRLKEHDGRWVITKRKCDLLMNQPDAVIPQGQSFLDSVLDLSDIS